MRAIATWCVRHRRIVLAGWLVGLVVLAGAVSRIGTGYENSFSLKGTQSFEAQRLLQRAAPKASGDREQIVIAVDHGTLRDPAVRQHAEQMLDRVAKLPEVASIGSPFTPAGAAQISKSGQVAFATVTMTKLATSFSTAQADRFVDTARSGAGDGLQVEVAGQVAEQSESPNDQSAGFGALAALIVLLLVFGSVLAALLPLITAGVALGVGISVIGLLSHVVTMADFSAELSLLIGLGVGVDYALFIVTRYRQGLEQGKPVEEAIVDAIDTSGRAVMFAGITVCIALLGMFALGVSFLYGVAIAAAVVVAFTVLSALTLLPALLGFMGPRALGRRRRRKLAASQLKPASESGFWVRWTGALQARPAVFALGAVVLLGALAIPFFSMRLGSSDASADPAGTTTHKAYELLVKGFGPGYNGPLQLVAEVDSNAQKVAFTKTLEAAADTPGVAAVMPATTLPGSGAGQQVMFAERLPVELAPGRVHQRSADATAGRHRAPHHRRNGSPHPDRRPDRDLLGLRIRAVEQAAPIHRRRRPALVPAAGCGVPQHRDSVHGCGDEHALGRCRIRCSGGGVPVGLGGFVARRHRDRPDRGVHPGDDVRDPVRAIDGL